MRNAMVRQFGQPSGALGWLAGQIMARRPSNRVRNRRTVELLDLHAGERVLEIGFGPGLAIAEAVSRLPSGHVVGVDHSLAMVRQAARRNADAIRRGQVTLCLGALETCGWGSGTFDKVFAVNVYLFWSDPAAQLQRIAALLKPGGTLALTHQPRQRGATNADAEARAKVIAQQMLAAGFTAVRTEVLPMAPVNAVCILGQRL
jgi:trans-aconitate methyltransferase